MSGPTSRPSFSVLSCSILFTRSPSARSRRRGKHKGRLPVLGKGALAYRGPGIGPAPVSYKRRARPSPRPESLEIRAFAPIGAEAPVLRCRRIGQRARALLNRRAGRSAAAGEAHAVLRDPRVEPSRERAGARQREERREPAEPADA